MDREQRIDPAQIDIINILLIKHLLNQCGSVGALKCVKQHRQGKAKLHSPNPRQPTQIDYLYG